MPPRLARSSVSTAAPKTVRQKNKKRTLNAYSIASHSAPDKSRVKQHRLGEFLDDRPAPKRRRDSEDDDVEALDDEDLRGTAKRRKATFDDGDIEEGSDSEGNEWTLGGLAEGDEDSDLDSEEAFGSSDEEKFEGFAFRGSKGGIGVKGKGGKKKGRRVERDGGEGGVGLEEGGGSSGEDEEDDEFGEEGVDLATMLDDDEDDHAEDGDEDEGESSGEDAGSGSDSESEDSEDVDDEEANARMRDRLEALDGGQQASNPKQTSQKNALSVDDLLADLDPSARKQFAAATKTKKRSERPTTLAAPLPKRQQDRINREVASQKAKEQLDRWRDTVIQNRRAEFLSFPLKHPDEGEPMGKDKFLETKPQNELEANIQRIMEESGMASKDGQNGVENEEDALMKAEGLAEQKMDVDEVMRRRAELRKMRELLFNEERKAKRISKIKSKSYRRVHRKEKTRQAERDREEREMLGLAPMDEDEREKQDRRRAEERMSTKHRDSKWAKQLKQTTRAAWDEGARHSVNEEARRREELRKRVEGKDVGSEDGSDDDDDFDDDGEDGDAFTLRKLDDLRKDGADGKAQKGLAGMKFMRDADARRKAQNDEDVERMRKELAIEDGDEAGSGDEIDDQGLGRAVFGPQGKKGPGREAKKPEKRPEMEEGSDSEGHEDEGEEAEIVTEKKADGQKIPEAASSKTNGKSFLFGKAAKPDQRNPFGSSTQQVDEADEGLSWFKSAKKSGKAAELDNGIADVLPATQALPAKAVEKGSAHDRAATPKPKDTDAGKTNGWTVVKHAADDKDASDSDPETPDPILTRAQQNTSLQRRAFAGDDVEAHFAAEKAAQEESENEKEESSHLPGWGSWTGTGLSKAVRKSNARQKHNPLFKHKLAGGVKKDARQDAKMGANVIVSEKEKQGRKGKKYLAGTLPRGFEKKEEYERSLRRPLGGEWGTKEVVQRSTRPRVTVEKGRVVGAMERPLV